MQSVISISNHFKCLYNFNHKMESVTGQSLQMEMFLFKALKWNLSFIFLKVSCLLAGLEVGNSSRWSCAKLAVAEFAFFFPEERDLEWKTLLCCIIGSSIPALRVIPIMRGSARLPFLTSSPPTEVLGWRLRSSPLWTWDYSSGSSSQCIINMLFPGS